MFDRSVDKSVSVDFIAFSTILIMALVFLFPALDNGFPFVYSDTGTYLGGLGLTHIPQHRPIYYAWFTRGFDLPVLVHDSTGESPRHLKGWSPWPSVLVQSLITAWMIRRFAAVFGLTRPARLVFLASILTLGTSLPWFVGQIGPDIFTPLMILALALLLFAQDLLARPLRLIVALFISATVAFHQANVLVALWMFPAMGLCALLGWRPSKAFLRGLFAGGIGLTLGVVALITANFVIDGRFALSNSGSVFLLARLLGDGTALRYLEKNCPQQHFAICDYLDELSSFSPRTDLNAQFLWGGPLDGLGGFRAEESEASAIVAGTLSAYPLMQLGAAVDNVWRQLSSFRTGQTLCFYPETDFLSRTIDYIFGALVYDHFRKSKQIRDIHCSRFEFINYIHSAVLLASSLVLVSFVLLGARQKQPRAFFVAVFVIVLMFGNAVMLGVFSLPDDRYQSRVIWLVPLIAACTLLERLPYPGHRKENP
jgi:hypothetical protein